ncbi:uncharacterized protein PRCAT00005772001 [Priceomyces carsonii]|uniref:uncharacterized protein n=1 Tax=Priceomyces carsonii TaxID=28549 RepID=UPI002EDA9722|nr:unnamed protein product [Priceomyces carsonii]
MSIIELLVETNREKYELSIMHPLTNELCLGTLPDHKLFTYLTQDLKYFKLGMNLFGKTLSLCDNGESAIILAKQIGFLASSENSYFENCLSEIRETSKQELEKYCSAMLLGNDSPTFPSVQRYLDYMRYLIHECSSYVQLITTLCVMEFVYLGWAEYNLLKGTVVPDLSYKYKEWVSLHSGCDFSIWVSFLKQEVDRVVITESDRTECEKTFTRVLDLEIEFFDSCYDGYD